MLRYFHFLAVPRALGGLLALLKGMETKNKITIHILLALTLFLGIGCADSNHSSSSGTTTTATSYYLNNGVCYTNTGTAVSNSYCTSTGYYLNNGSCYNSTGNIVLSTYCSGTSSTGTTNQCVGYYYYITGYGSQMVACYGANCRGYTLYELATQRMVTCF